MQQIYIYILSGYKVLYPLLLGCGMVFLYNRKSLRMKRFYYRMTCYEKARRLYAYFFFFMMLFYSYCCMETGEHARRMVLDNLLVLPFMFRRAIAYILQKLTDSADLMLGQLVVLMALGLATENHCLVVIGLTYLVAAMFYPSAYLYNEIHKLEEADFIDEILPCIWKYYYGRPRFFLSNYLKHLAQNICKIEVNNDKEE